jgi:2-alkenal reductase
MSGRGRFWLFAGIGCAILVVLLVVVIPLAYFTFLPMTRGQTNGIEVIPPAQDVTVAPGTEETQVALPTLTTAPGVLIQPSETDSSVSSDYLSALYQDVVPGVVNIQVFVQRGGGFGEGAGSGFILDREGIIITNYHVVANAENILVVFYNGLESPAEVIGTDNDSDLAVLRVQAVPEGAHALPLGDSNQIHVGQWVVAIGNPFGLGSSMSIGIISALERTIAAVATPFSIPQAIQTDAAINPGNSGGPLINLQGEVIGVNAQIATAGGGTSGNLGVGFAIPSNVVRQVAPALIESGVYQWPWLGVRGTSVNWFLQQANNLPSQQGAYMVEIIPGGPADEAGLQGASSEEMVQGIAVPSGGDVVVQVDDQPVSDYNDLITYLSFQEPGQEVLLQVVRDGETVEVPVVLAARPESFTE